MQAFPCETLNRWIDGLYYQESESWISRHSRTIAKALTDLADDSSQSSVTVDSVVLLSTRHIELGPGNGEFQ